MRVLGYVLLVLVVAGCGGAPKALDAGGGNLPSLRKRCGDGQVDAKVGWFRAPDGVLLDGAALGDGKTGVVLAHESPADLCGWIPYARVLGRAGLRVLDRHGAGQRLPTAARGEKARAQGGIAAQAAVFFPGGYHGWDLLSVARYRLRASRVVISFLRRYG